MSRIGANAFCVLMVISSHIDPVERKCFPSRGRIQKMTGLGEEAVRNAIKKLESLGLLEMKQSRGEHGRMKQPEYCVTSDHIGVYIPARRVRMEDSPGLGQPHTVQPHTADPDLSISNIEVISQKEIILADPENLSNKLKERPGFGVEPQVEATAARDAPTFLVNHLSRMRMRDIVKRIVGGDGMKKERSSYGSKDRLISDVLVKMIDSGFVHQSDNQTRSYIKAFVQGRVSESDGQEFSEDTEKEFANCVEMVLKKRPFVSKVQPIRDFEIIQLKSAIESGMNWHLFSVIMQELCDSVSPEFCKVSYALGKFKDDYSEKIKTAYSSRMNYLKMIKQ